MSTLVSFVKKKKKIRKMSNFKLVAGKQQVKGVTPLVGEAAT